MENYEWAKEMNCAVTVCDAEGVIIYMNDKSRETYKKEGDLIGKNLMGCHSERSREIIRHLLETVAATATPSRSRACTRLYTRRHGRRTERLRVSLRYQW